jgi:histidyl-tRNA synthetase
VELPGAPQADVFIAALGEEAERWVFRTTQDLREAGLHVALDLKGRSLKAQMKEANRQNADYTLIIGGNELEAKEATVKEMESGEQVDVPFDELTRYLRKRTTDTGETPERIS